MVTHTKCLSRANNFRIVAYTIITTLCVPLILIISTLIVLYRQFIQMFVKYIYTDKNILKIVNPITQLVAPDQLKPNPRMNIIFCWIGEGKMTIETLREIVETKIVNKKINKNGIQEFLYPELKCCLETVFGYYYWKTVTHFDLNQYVRYFDCTHQNTLIKEKFSQSNNYTDNVITEDDLKNIIPDLLAKNWKQGQSQWEFLLINNYVNKVNPKIEKTAIIFRIHHSMADGYSILNILNCLNEGEFKPTATPDSNLKRKLNTLGQKTPILGRLMTSLIFPYQVALALDKLLHSESHSWMVCPKQRAKIGQKYHQNWTSLIPVDSIKEIKNKFGVSFAAVVNSILAGAIQELMKSVGQKVPKNVTTISMVPLPGHPGGLVNHFGYLPVRLPTGEEDSLKRLKMAFEELKKLEKSAFPLVSFIMYYFVGLFPTVLTKSIFSLNCGFSLGVSAFAGVDGQISWGGCKNLEGFHVVATAIGDTGASFSAYSGLQSIRITLTIDDLVFPSKDALLKLDEIIQRECDTLINANRLE